MQFRRRADSDFHDEIEAHIRLEADRLIAEGMPTGEAHAAARCAFRNVGITQERFYESHRWVWWDQFLQDVRHGLRSLRKTPAFTAAASIDDRSGSGCQHCGFQLDGRRPASVTPRAESE